MFDGFGTRRAHMGSMLTCLDDVVVFTETFEQHLEHLTMVFNCLRQAGLKLKAFCILGQNFLGSCLQQNESNQTRKKYSSGGMVRPSNFETSKRFCCPDLILPSAH